MSSKNCNNCKHLEWVDGDSVDGHDLDSGFVCNAKDYRDEKRERVHLEQLSTEAYRARPKKCCEVKQ